MKRHSFFAEMEQARKERIERENGREIERLARKIIENEEENVPNGDYLSERDLSQMFGVIARNKNGYLTHVVCERTEGELI